MKYEVIVTDGSSLLIGFEAREKVLLSKESWRFREIIKLSAGFIENENEKVLEIITPTSKTVIIKLEELA